MEIIVKHFYGHPVLFPFMSQELYEILEDADRHNQVTALVPRVEFERMINAYLDTLKN
jgi:hypothetical protein